MEHSVVQPRPGTKFRKRVFQLILSAGDRWQSSYRTEQAVVPGCHHDVSINFCSSPASVSKNATAGSAGNKHAFAQQKCIIVYNAARRQKQITDRWIKQSRKTCGPRITGRHPAKVYRTDRDSARHSKSYVSGTYYRFRKPSNLVWLKLKRGISTAASL